MVFGSEPYADALIFEPLPYRSALKENCTHVIVLRTRSDNVRTTVKAGLIERTMTKRFFGNKQNLPSMVNWMHNQVQTWFSLTLFFLLCSYSGGGKQMGVFHFITCTHIYTFSSNVVPQADIC